jgi:hypothetical protein
MIFRRGLVNAFQKLSRDYKSNDGFKIGDRIVTTYGCSFDKTCNWFRLGEYAEKTIADVDRVMHVLDGKPAPTYQQGVCAKIRTAMSDYRSGGPTEVETPYWRAKFFKNGNIHLWTRPSQRARISTTSPTPTASSSLAAAWWQLWAPGQSAAATSSGRNSASCSKWSARSRSCRPDPSKRAARWFAPCS